MSNGYLAYMVRAVLVIFMTNGCYRSEAWAATTLRGGPLSDADRRNTNHWAGLPGCPAAGSGGWNGDSVRHRRHRWVAI